MTFSDTVMMELGITQSTDTRNKRSSIRTSHVCQRHRAAGRNQQVEGYKHKHTQQSSNTESCAKRLCQILANNIYHGGRVIGLRIYKRYCLKK